MTRDGKSPTTRPTTPHGPVAQEPTKAQPQPSTPIGPTPGQATKPGTKQPGLPEGWLVAGQMTPFDGGGVFVKAGSRARLTPDKGHTVILLEAGEVEVVQH